MKLCVVYRHGNGLGVENLDRQSREEDHVMQKKWLGIKRNEYQSSYSEVEDDRPY